MLFRIKSNIFNLETEYVKAFWDKYVRSTFSILNIICILIFRLKAKGWFFKIII